MFNKEVWNSPLPNWGAMLDEEQNNQIDRLNREVAALKNYLNVEIVKEPERLVVKKLKK